MRAIWITTLFAASFATLGLSGCTVWGAKNPPTLKSATSAEQYEKIFWDKARDGQWKDISPLLGSNIVYAVSGQIVSRDQIIPYLQSRNIKDFVIGQMTAHSNGPDMTVSYTIQLSGKQGETQNLIAVSVWQQVLGSWILIAHTEQPAQTN